MKTAFQILSIVSLGLSILSSTAAAQGIAPFSGRGVKEDQGSAPNWFGPKGSIETNEKNQSNGWFGQGILRSARPGEVENRPGFLGSLLQRPSNEPGLIQRASDKSREMMERTRSWAAEKNDAIKTRTTQTWDTLTSGLRPNADSSKSRESMPAPYDGANRFAENPGAAKTEKF